MLGDNVDESLESNDNGKLQLLLRDEFLCSNIKFTYLQIDQN